MVKRVVTEETGSYDNCMDIAKREVQGRKATLFDNEVADVDVEVNPASLSDNSADHWIDMPEFEQENKKTYKTIYVHFRSEEDYLAFAKALGLDPTVGEPFTKILSDKTKSIWYPTQEITKNSLLRWIENE